LKKSYHSLQRLVWYLGDQKEHRATRKAVPPGSFVSEAAVLIFAQNIDLCTDVLMLSGTRFRCAAMPPYLEPAGMIEIGAQTINREGSILQTYIGVITMGRNCMINPYCLIHDNGGVEIADNASSASHVCMYPANQVFADATLPIRAQGETLKSIPVESDVYIGGGGIILDGVSIVDGVVIAAGAVVNRDIVAGEGVPGHPVRARG
jgi:acetyltransferase-like isoleucine patch superfamily enzyme